MSSPDGGAAGDDLVPVTAGATAIEVDLDAATSLAAASGPLWDSSSDSSSAHSMHRMLEPPQGSVQSTPPRVQMSRNLYDEELFFSHYPKADYGDEYRGRGIKDLLPKCSAPTLGGVKHAIGSRMPILSWVPGYNLRQSLLGDMVIGLSIGVFLVPQGLAYAQLASLPPIYGLYMAIMPSIVYVFLGECREMSMGSFALTSLLVGNAIAKIEPDVDVLLDTNPDRLAEIAVALSLLVGVLQLIFFFLKAGYLTVFMSPALVSGFTTGAAFHIASSQLRHAFGLPSRRFTEIPSLLHRLVYILRNLGDTNVATLVICIISIIMLWVCKFFSDGGKVRWHPTLPGNKRVLWPGPDVPRLKFPIPGELIVLMIGTTASHLGRFKDNFSVAIVGEIPAGLPPFTPPNFGDLGEVLTSGLADVIVLAIISFAITASISRTFSAKFKYPISPDQDMFALAVANIVSSFFSCYVSAGSLSRSVLIGSLNVNSQFHAATSVVIMLLVLLFITDLFRDLPNAILAAVILMALRGLFRQFSDAKRYWRLKRTDFVMWISAFLGVIFLDISIGLFFGIGVSLFLVIYGSVKPYSCTLGQVADTEIYRDISRVQDAEPVDGIKIFRYHAPLYFANRLHFKNHLYAKTVNPGSATDHSDCHTIILDMSMSYDVDSAGVLTLIEVCNSLKTDKQIRLLLANCHGGVRDMLTKAKFYNHVAKQSLFVSVHDAVLYALTFSGVDTYLDDEDSHELEAVSQHHIQAMDNGEVVDRPVMIAHRSTALLLGVDARKRTLLTESV